MKGLWDPEESLKCVESFKERGYTHKCVCTVGECLSILIEYIRKHLGLLSDIHEELVILE